MVSVSKKEIFMNLRCIYCQTPFTLSRPEMLSAIITMNEKHQSHYDAHCPRCRRANSISRQRMELFFPNWQDAAKQLASAPPSAPNAEAPASAFLKTEPLPKVAKAMAEKKTATSSPKGKKPVEKAAKKPVKATAEKKPAAKKTAEPKAKKK
jgi:hypothetical protein